MRRLLTIILLALIISPSISSAQAQSQPDDTVGITVTPITDEFTISPGEIKSRTISVINPGTEVITLYPRALDFTTDNENGQPAFFESNDESMSYTLSRWMRFDREFIRVAANEEEHFEVVIQAPKDAEPGGHYGTVLFSTEKPKEVNDQTTKVSVVGLVGTLLLATVPGDVSEQLEIEQFNVPRIVFGSPANVDLLFKNSGNIHVKPKGEIIIRNWSGNQTKVLPVNEGNGNVLPESRRKFSQSWQFSLGNIGLYRVTAQLTYGTNPQTLTATRQIIILPYWVILAVVVLAALIILLVIKLRRARQPKPVPPPILR